MVRGAWRDRGETIAVAETIRGVLVVHARRGARRSTGWRHGSFIAGFAEGEVRRLGPLGEIPVVGRVQRYHARPRRRWLLRARDPDAAPRALVEPLDSAVVGATGDVPALVALLRDGLRERFDEEPAPRRQTLLVDGRRHGGGGPRRHRRRSARRERRASGRCGPRTASYERRLRRHRRDPPPRPCSRRPRTAGTGGRGLYQEVLRRDGPGRAKGGGQRAQRRPAKTAEAWDPVDAGAIAPRCSGREGRSFVAKTVEELGRTSRRTTRRSNASGPRSRSSSVACCCMPASGRFL